MTTIDEIERLLRVGMCSPGRHAETGCATCDRCEAAIAEVRLMEARRLELSETIDAYAELLDGVVQAIDMEDDERLAAIVERIREARS
ncbi:MAG TPA: hypothetical protein VLT45_05920 [Kofleriaceae bacterium]|nr:hypothetical protein [Kofleriaceae bacterium]